MQPAVLVISGIPGAGKSTIAAIVARRLGRSSVGRPLRVHPRGSPQSPISSLADRRAVS